MPDSLPGPRLRQVALVAHDCEKTAATLQETFGWPDPFHDPGVGEFGLINAVFPVGDTFVEVVSPVQPDTTAGRYLARRGSDSGYMAIFQMPSLEEARRRVADLGVRVVWKVDLEDIAGTHLHPKDIPGAIVSLDWASPTSSWRWAGPAWTGTAPDHPAGGHRRHHGRGGRPGRGGSAVGPGAWARRGRQTAGKPWSGWTRPAKPCGSSRRWTAGPKASPNSG